MCCEHKKKTFTLTMLSRQNLNAIGNDDKIFSMCRCDTVNVVQPGRYLYFAAVFIIETLLLISIARLLAVAHNWNWFTVNFGKYSFRLITVYSAIFIFFYKHNSNLTSQFQNANRKYYNFLKSKLNDIVSFLHGLFPTN